MSHALGETRTAALVSREPLVSGESLVSRSRGSRVIQTFTFGWIYRNLLRSDPQLALTFTGILMLMAAVAMLWIRQTPVDRETGKPTPASKGPAATPT
jgi:hypothetical protein